MRATAKKRYGRRVLKNRKIIYRQILTQYGTLSNFANTYEANYLYLQMTLSGKNFYRDSFLILEKAGYNPVREPKRARKKNRKTANTGVV